MSSTWDELVNGSKGENPFAPFVKTDDERITFGYLWNNPTRHVPFRRAMIALSHLALGQEPFEYFKDRRTVFSMASKVGQVFLRKECNYAQKHWNAEHCNDERLILNAFIQWLGSRALRLECSARLKGQFSKERDGITFQVAATEWLLADAQRFRNLYFTLNTLLERTIWT